MITCRKMTAELVPDAFAMLSTFLSEDEHYLASSKAYGARGTEGLMDALGLFLTRPELGFVWLAYDDQGVAGGCHERSGHDPRVGDAEEWRNVLCSGR